MANEEIITALKNAIDHGDSLGSAKQIMINSGYNPKEVEEASRFVGGGVIKTHEPKPGEQLAMPTEKKLFGIFKRKPKTPAAPAQPPAAAPAQPPAAAPAQPPAAAPAQPPAAAPAQPPAAAPAQPPAAAPPAPATEPTTAIQPQPLQKQQVSAQQLKQEITSPETVPRAIQQVNQPQNSEKIQVAPLALSQEPAAGAQLKQVQPKKPGHIKEIILLVILLALIGILVTTIILKDTILGWFSG